MGIRNDRVRFEDNLRETLEKLVRDAVLFASARSAVADAESPDSSHLARAEMAVERFRDGLLELGILGSLQECHVVVGGGGEWMLLRFARYLHRRLCRHLCVGEGEEGGDVVGRCRDCGAVCWVIRDTLRLGEPGVRSHVLR